jgi:hypothetical protein
VALGAGWPAAALVGVLLGIEAAEVAAGNGVADGVALTSAAGRRGRSRTSQPTSTGASKQSSAKAAQASSPSRRFGLAAATRVVFGMMFGRLLMAEQPMVTGTSHARGLLGRV